MKRTAAAGLGALLLGLLILPLSLYRDRTPVGGEAVPSVPFAEKPAPLPPIRAAIRPPAPDGRERDAMNEAPLRVESARKPFPRRLRTRSRARPRPSARPASRRVGGDINDAVLPLDAVPKYALAQRLYEEEFWSAALKYYQVSLRDELPLLGATRRATARARLAECRAKLKRK